MSGIIALQTMWVKSLESLPFSSERIALQTCKLFSGQQGSIDIWKETNGVTLIGGVEGVQGHRLTR